eukprot:5910984-Pyramimonas_sp.AAC.1
MNFLATSWRMTVPAYVQQCQHVPPCAHSIPSFCFCACVAKVLACQEPAPDAIFQKSAINSKPIEKQFFHNSFEGCPQGKKKLNNVGRNG